MITEGEIWLVNFPFEENPNQFLPRPVIVLNVDLSQILSTKVTKHDPRASDQYDTPIQYWKEANLKYPSTARVSKTVPLMLSNFIHFIGRANSNDLLKIQEMYTDFFFKHM